MKAVLCATAALLAVTVTAAHARDTEKSKARSAISIQCSKQADAKGLHGKARHAFRSKCKREGTKLSKS